MYTSIILLLHHPNLPYLARFLAQPAAMPKTNQFPSHDEAAESEDGGDPVAFVTEVQRRVEQVSCSSLPPLLN